VASSPRQKRLEKLRAHREKVVEDRLVALARARQLEDAARQALEREQAQLVRAQSERQSAFTRTIDVTSLTVANDWLISCGKRRDLAQQQVARAAEGVTRAQGDVVGAKNDLKKIELLFERLRTHERVSAERSEQRQSDELSAQRFQITRRRGET
jgi:flagellar export protein FliJ